MNNLVLIDEKNFSDFRVVLPAGINLCPERIIIGCYDDDASILGALSFVMADYEYEIDWLYVIPQARRKEVATTLIRSFFDFMAKTGEIYPVRALFEVTDENSLLYKFFLSVPEFDVSFSHHRYYVDNKEISASQELKKDLMLQLEEKKFFSLEEKEQLEILHELENDCIYVVENYDSWSKSCVPNLCRVAVRENRIEGAIFILWRTDGNLELSYLYSRNPLSTKNLVQLTAKDIMKFFPGCSLVFDTVTPASEKMAKKIFPNTNPINIYKAEW